MNWICCQIGAREHYAVARSLNRHGALECLLTDAWVQPSNPLGRIRGRLRERFHTELAKARISASNGEIIGFELRAKITGLDGWSRITRRNSWFQKMAVERLSKLGATTSPRTVFAFSYAARQIFRFARARGWRTVLGQIDAGPVGERAVARAYTGDKASCGHLERPPAQYWADWREECTLADRIVVNSRWSQAALEEEGIAPSKIRVVPLAYEPPADAAEFRREYPKAFARSRPLRVLFLGSICVGKGVRPLFEAIRLLRGEAVEFWFVGEVQVSVPPDLLEDPQVHWIGAVPRTETARFYRDSDVFVFPTFSDGFGLTQLEAQAWKLPIIATKYCGNVVEHGRNGWLLAEPTGATIAAAITSCLAEPERLEEFAENAVSERFGLTQIGDKLLHIFK